MGTVVLEAMGAGVPVLCLDHQGAHDAVTESCGIKIPVVSPQDTIARLAAAIDSLARQPQRCRELGRAAKDRAKEYLWSRQGEAMAVLYRRVLEQANHRTEPTQAAPKASDRDGYPAQWLTLLRRRIGLGVSVPLRAIWKRPVGEGFGILLYHRVSTVADGMRLPAETVSRTRFREQLRGLLARGYTPWPLRKALAYYAEGWPIPPKTFVITFDDGCECLYHEAWPILRELGVPATIFLVTACLDTDRPLSFPRQCAATRSSYPAFFCRSLSTAECAEMLASGLVELGSHSHTHADFRDQPNSLEADFRASIEVLRDRFGLADAPFAFPYGYFTAAMSAALEKAGATCALTTSHDLVAPRSNRFAWGRFVVENYDTSASLAVKLDGWYTLLQNAWHRWQGRVGEELSACR
jgi:peptidoglycan/xylan/chitin deacetylase (PgdA/CDA1 family)